MPINPVNIKPQSINQFSFARRFARGMGTGAMLPLIALECFVTGGRTIQAYKRGGFDEARERFTEEAIGAAFWFAGVKCFNRMNDWIGQKVLNLKDTNFDVGRDKLRNPLANYLKDKGNGISDKTIGKFKLAKVGASIVLANILVGLVVPKINQKITVKLHNEREEEQQKRLKGTADVQGQPITSPEGKPKTQEPDEQSNYFKHSINDFAQNKDSKALSFGMGAQRILSLANHFENDNVYQLLSTDVGIAGGRAISSRNKHERTEVLFRDLSSIYFYMFNIPNIHLWLNLIEDGKKSRLDPVASKQVTDHLKLAMEESPKEGLSATEFRKLALGDDTNLGFMTKELDSKFDHDIMKLEDLKAQIKKNTALSPEQIKEFINRAERMSTLQPKAEGISILTKIQVEDVFKGGAINMPEFLNNLYGLSSNNEMFGKSTTYKHQDPYKYVSQDELAGLKKDVIDYVERIIKKAERSGKKITLDTIVNADRVSFAKNAFNRTLGFGISALFLSTLIPRMQYWITEKMTGKNTFPGMTDYSDEANSKK